MVLQVVVPNSAGKKTCYHQLESASKGGTATTNRVEWFLLCLGRSIAKADGPVARIVEKFRIWEEIKARKFNDCQRLMINRLLDGFEGKLHTSK